MKREKITKKIDKFVKKSSLVHPGEYGKRCDLCHKNRESHQYYRPIDGEWMKLCDECWSKVETERKRKAFGKD